MIGAYKKAIDEFTKSIGLDPEFAYAYFLRGLAREQLGQDELATEDFEEADSSDFEADKADFCVPTCTQMPT